MATFDSSIYTEPENKERKAFKDRSFYEHFELQMEKISFQIRKEAERQEALEQGNVLALTKNKS